MLSRGAFRDHRGSGQTQRHTNKGVEMAKLSKRDQEQMEKAKDLMENGSGKDLGFLRSLFFGRLRLEKVWPYPRAPRHFG